MTILGASRWPPQIVIRYTAMSAFRTATFWLLILPSAVVFALPGAILGDEVAFEKWAPVILPLQAFVTVALPYVLARRVLIERAKQARGFAVVQHIDANRQAV